MGGKAMEFGAAFAPKEGMRTGARLEAGDAEGVFGLDPFCILLTEEYDIRRGSVRMR